MRVGVAVEEAVVAPLPLHHLVLAGVGASEADGGLRGLGAGVGEAQLLDAGHRLDDLAPDLVVQLVRERVEHAARGDLGHDRVEDGLGAVAEDHGAVADAPVDVRVAVHVVEVGALAALHDDRAGADEARVAGLAAGDDLLALGEHLLGLLQMTVVDDVGCHRPRYSSTNGRAQRGYPRVWGRVPGRSAQSTGRTRAGERQTRVRRSPRPARRRRSCTRCRPMVGLRALVEQHEAQDHREGAELRRRHAGDRGAAPART